MMNKLETKEKISILWYWGVFITYTILRCIAWKNTALLEDYDSLFLMEDMKTFLSFNLNNIINMRPDSTPLYPFFGALCGIFGWSVEIGARLCSLIFSSLLFLCLVLIGKRITKPFTVIIGLLILSFSPVLISLSYSVLTEPSYIAVCYLGLWLFLVQYKNPKLWQAGLLGLIFGLSFLSRTEGLFYIAVIPFMQLVHYFFFKPRDYAFKRMSGWICVYVLIFGLVAAPQIWRVSHKMGQLAINGRQVWTVILKNPDQENYQEKIYGLDYSPKEINLGYLQSHPEAAAKLVSNAEFKNFLKNSLYEFDELYQKNLGILVGPFGIAFFAIGLLALYVTGFRFECFVFLAFIGSSLVAPLVHNVAIRHIAIIAPLIILVEGIGIVHVFRVIEENNPFNSKSKILIPAIFLFGIIGSFFFPLKHIYLNQPKYNNEYNPERIKRIASVVKGYANSLSLEAPKIASRRAYLAYYAGMEGSHLPYADYEKMVRYCDLNDVDFIFFEHRTFKKHPFYKEFINKNNHSEFELLYHEQDDFGEDVELYRFHKNKMREI